MTQRPSRVRANAPSTSATTSATATVPPEPSSPLTTESRPSTPPPRKRSIMTTSDILSNLKDPSLGVYIGKPGLPSSALFFLGGTNGDILISSSSREELTLRGVFQISRSDCFLAPDGAFTPNNQFQSKFEDVKLSCKLSVPNHDDFRFMHDDLSKIEKNMKGLEDLIDKQSGATITSSFQTSGGWMHIKIVHPLFVKKDKKSALGHEISESHLEGPQKSDISEELGEEFSIENWPVNDRCKPLLDQLIEADTHNINPLPAYDINHDPLPPHKYKDALPGAVVLASFVLTHFHLKASKRHIFNAACREIVILRSADDLPSSPYKKKRFGKRPLFERGVDNDSTTASSSFSALD